MQHTSIFADGSSIGNPGPGGWGVSIIKEGMVEEHGGFHKETTNNRMELTAAIEALKRVDEGVQVTIHTDSQYVINGITKWVFGWEKNGWLTKEKKDVLNKDLWQKLSRVSRTRQVTWEHVRGHSGIPENERVDQIANGLARKERVKRFMGSEHEYREFLKTMPKPRTASLSKKSKKSGPAYAYVSLLDGRVLSHKTWAECEKRVKGKPAKYKKVFSVAEERELIAEWSKK